MIQADAHHLPLKDDSVDCIITSPPYFGCGYYESPVGLYDWKLGLEDNVEEYAKHIFWALKDCKRVLKEGGVLWLILGDSDNHIPIFMAPQRVAIEMINGGWVLAQEIHWFKTHQMTGRVRCFCHPGSTTEKVYMFVNGGTHRYYDSSSPTGNVWKISPGSWEKNWATLPDALIRNCIMSSTVPGQVVLDPFAGSCAVQRVAEYWDRVGISCDIVIP